jgi:hypothetical protein
MLTMLRGSSNSVEMTVIPSPESKPQELMTFIEREFHPIASPPDLPIESRVMNFQSGSKEESLEGYFISFPKVSCRRRISGCSERITLLRAGLLRGPANPLQLKEQHFIKAPFPGLALL